MAWLRSFVDDNPEGDGQGPGAPPPPPATGGGAFFPDFTGLFNHVVDNAQPGGGNGGVGGPNFGDLGGRPAFNFRGVPKFTPPAFQRPTVQDALSEPGYDFRLRGGADSLERSAAAKGVLRTGGTLKDLVEYGQNFASQEYGNVFNRALQEYDRKYMGAKDAFAPQLAEWQTLSQAELAAALAQYQRKFDLYKFANRNTGGGGGGGDDTYDPEPEF